MNRRTLFHVLTSVLGLAPAARATITPTAAATTRIVLQRSSVRGFRHRHHIEFLGQFQPGAPLTLRAEPANPHDRRAVMVLWQDHHLGYLPREDNAHASRLLRQGLPLQATLLSVEPDRYEWEPLRIEVALNARSLLPPQKTVDAYAQVLPH